jgi:hypothetical protein
LERRNALHNRFAIDLSQFFGQLHKLSGRSDRNRQGILARCKQEGILVFKNQF